MEHRVSSGLGSPVSSDSLWEIWEMSQYNLVVWNYIDNFKDHWLRQFIFFIGFLTHTNALQIEVPSFYEVNHLEFFFLLIHSVRGQAENKRSGEDLEQLKRNEKYEFKKN